MTHTYDFLIVGAGIVGLTVAYQLKSQYPQSKIAIIEKEILLGAHASGRNSGILHSGVYYGNESLKAKACSRGAASMRDFAAEHGIACKKNGKVIIATSENDLIGIDKLLENAKNNSVRAERLNEKEIKEIEPYATPYEAGIFCPDTAVIDNIAVINKLKELLEINGTHFFLNAHIEIIKSKERKLKTSEGNFSYNFIFNCAGAGADLLAKQFGLAENYTFVPFKGTYYKLKNIKNNIVNSNIYPVPNLEQPFLGVHISKGIFGDVYVGPTAIPAFGRENYGFFEQIKFGETLKISRTLFMMFLKNHQNFRNHAYSELKKYSKEEFFLTAKKLVKSINLNDFVRDAKVGIRPQIVNTKTFSLETDFILERDNYSIHILNSISPAFTCAFEFAKIIVHEAEKSFL
jgi:L-2-hydroxyglutarate oxidase